MLTTLFCSKTTEELLKPLTDILSSLKNEVTSDVNLNPSRCKWLVYDGKPYQRSEHQRKVTKLSLSEDWPNLYDRLNDLYQHLKSNKESYGSGCISEIAKKSQSMVLKINTYLEVKNKAHNETELKQAITAISDFYSAFELSQAKNMVLAVLALGIIGAVLTLLPLGIPAVVAGFKAWAIGAAAGGSGGILLTKLRSLFLVGDTTDLKRFADAAKRAAEGMLKLESKKHAFESEKEVFEWLKKLFNFSDNKYVGVSSNPTFAHRLKVHHEDFVGEGATPLYLPQIEGIRNLLLPTFF